MGNFSFSWGSTPKPLSVERNIEGDWFYEVWNSTTEGKKRFASERSKIEAVLCNPAALRVFKINCDLFSLGKINKFEGDVEIEKDFLYSVTKKPNHFQSWTQFLWDGMFWIQCGTGYMYRSNNNLSESSQLYWLNPACISWDGNWKDRLSKWVFSVTGFRQMQDEEKITYTWPDGSTSRIRLKEITPFFDLSNGISGNWYKGESDLDALYKVITNSELALDAKSINLEFSQKFVVTGKADPINHLQPPMGPQEAQSAEESIRGRKKVHAMKSQIDIKRFVENMAQLKLDEAFFNDYFTIGAMKGIPRDILEVSLKSATYENQEKSIGRHVEYALKPKGQMITDAFESLFNFQDLRMSWAHCMFNQVFEKDKAERQAIQLANLVQAKALGMDDAEIKKQVALIMTM